jgi:hypothetical protein
VLPPSLLQIDRQEPRLRRVPAADHLHPDAPPPSPLAWEQRLTRRVGPDQFLITIPCLTAPHQSGIDARLTDELRRRWTTVAPRAPWHITNVAAAFEDRPGQISRINVALTATVQAVGAPPLDSPAMARDLRDALGMQHA